MKDYQDLIRRLRGEYRIPITDGLGPTGGGEEPHNPKEFVRTFETTPIQREAAEAIETLFTLAKGLRLCQRSAELQADLIEKRAGKYIESDKVVHALRSVADRAESCLSEFDLDNRKPVEP